MTWVRGSMAWIVGCALAVGAVLGLTQSRPVAADCGVGNPFMVRFAPSQILSPTMQASVVEDCTGDGIVYDFTAKGYLKIAGRTVARLAPFTGHAEPRPQPFTIAVAPPALSAVR
jgi:hypothetical protein